MGIIDKILFKKKVSENPPNNDRLCVELCENVHLHYRNIRIEFTPEEFIDLVKMFEKISAEEVSNFEYSDTAFKEIARVKLNPETHFSDRMQVELQTNKTIHIHYRNLRLEFDE